MRAFILIAGFLALGACSKNGQQDNSLNVDEDQVAQNIVSNDVTALDAVTGDAANMAAAASIEDLADLSNDAGNTQAVPKPTPETRNSSSSPAPKPKPKPAPAPQPSNSAENAL